MVTNVKVEILYKGDNQWVITFERNGEDHSFSHIREIELVSMYHCLAKELNEKHNCEFTFLESEIARCKNAITSTGDHRNWHWTLRTTWGGSVELLHYYKYSSVSGLSATTYGDFEVEEIKEIVKELGKFVLSNDVHQLSYENMKKAWLSDMSRGWTNFRVYDCYKHLFEKDEDFSAENILLAKKKARHDLWKRDADHGISLLCNYYAEMRVNITNDFLLFYRKEGEEYASYKYPPLRELKHDEAFIKAITDYLVENGQHNKDSLNNWIEGVCDLPPFPLEAIYYCDYENYDYREYELR